MAIKTSTLKKWGRKAKWHAPINDSGAYGFLKSRGYTKARITALLREFQTGVHPRIADDLERSAVRRLAGFDTPAWLWQHAAESLKQKERSREASDAELSLLRHKFNVAVERALAINVRVADDEKPTEEELRALDKALVARSKRFPSYSALFLEIERICPELAEVDQRILTRWADEECPGLKSNRGRKNTTRKPK